MIRPDRSKECALSAVNKIAILKFGNIVAFNFVKPPPKSKKQSGDHV